MCSNLVCLFAISVGRFPDIIFLRILPVALVTLQVLVVHLFIYLLLSLPPPSSVVLLRHAPSASHPQDSPGKKPRLQKHEATWWGSHVRSSPDLILTIGEVFCLISTRPPKRQVRSGGWPGRKTPVVKAGGLEIMLRYIICRKKKDKREDGRWSAESEGLSCLVLQKKCYPLARCTYTTTLGFPHNKATAHATSSIPHDAAKVITQDTVKDPPPIENPKSPQSNASLPIPHDTKVPIDPSSTSTENSTKGLLEEAPEDFEQPQSFTIYPTFRYRYHISNYSCYFFFCDMIICHSIRFGVETDYKNRLAVTHTAIIHVSRIHFPMSIASVLLWLLEMYPQLLACTRVLDYST